MGEFRVLSDEELNALSSKERRNYLKELRYHKNEQLVKDVIASNNEDSDTTYKALSLNSGTSKNIIDIDIDLIDNDELNENLFGYEDVALIEESMNTFGDKSVINVYERGNGRYLCYSGNQRLIALKNLKAQKVTCFVDGPEPTKDTRTEALIYMNAQRTRRPLYIARQITAFEKILRSKGEKNVSDKIKRQFGYETRTQQQYKQILSFPQNYQTLFGYESAPINALIDCYNKLPKELVDKYVDALNSRFKIGDISQEIVKATYLEIMKDAKKDNDEIVKKVKRLKTSQAFKSIFALPYFEKGEEILIPENKKKEILTQIEGLEDYIERLKEACE